MEKKIVAGGCRKDFDECYCSHHALAKLPGVVICCQCCSPCRYCGKNIVLVLYESHEEKCREEKGLPQDYPDFYWPD